MKIDHWFQGVARCDGQPGNFFGAWSGFDAQCLATQGQRDNLQPQDYRRLADIIDRHFAARCVCQRGDGSPIMRIIHFNNSPETTREDIDKVLRIYTEETERDPR